MSLNTRIIGRCMNFHEHSEASDISPFLIDTERENFHETDDRLQGLRHRVTSSVTTMCASETDEGDYETCSDGMVPSKPSSIEIYRAPKDSLCGYFKEESTSLRKLSVFDENKVPIKKQVIFDPQHELLENRLTQKTTYMCRLMPESLAESKSIPILKSEMPNSVSASFNAMDYNLTSKSSFARKKKLSMIVDSMAPFISSYPFKTVFVTISKTNFREQQYEARKLESRTMLPVLNDTTSTMINDGRSEEFIAEVILHETKNSRHTLDQNSSQHTVRTSVDDEGTAKLTNDDNLIDVARNPCSSIKSMYFPPNPPDTTLSNGCTISKRHQRASTDMIALQKIDYELGPLRYQFSEIIGKARALGLANDIGTFNLGTSYHSHQRDHFGRSDPTSNVSDYSVEHDEIRFQYAAMDCSVEGQTGIVGKTTTLSPTFSVVGKPIPKGSHTCWLNANDSSGRQEALNLAIHNHSQTLEKLDNFYRVRDSTLHFPTNSHNTIQEKNNLTASNERFYNKCVSNCNLQYRNVDIKTNTSFTAMEKDVSWQDWSSHERIISDPSNTLHKTKRHLHQRHSRQTTNISRISDGNLLEMQNQESSMSRDCFGKLSQQNVSRTTCHSSSTIVERIDNSSCKINKVSANKQLSRHSEDVLGNPESMAKQKGFVARDDNHKYSKTEIEYFSKNDEISSPRLKKLSHRDISSDQQILHAVSMAASTPQVRNLNTEFHATVEKRYTSRAVSPIQNSCSMQDAATVLSMTSGSDIATVSSTFVQQVQADPSTEISKVVSSTEKFPIDVRKDNIVDTTSEKDSCFKKASRLNAEDPSKFLASGKNGVDLTMIKSGNTKYLCIPETTKKIKIVPIIFTDDISEPTETADAGFAVSRNTDDLMPKLDYPIASFKTRKPRTLQLPLTRHDKISGKVSEFYTSAYVSEELVNEKRWNTSKTSICISHGSLYTQNDYVSSTISLARNSKRHARIASSHMKVSRKTRECRESVKPKVVTKAIPGMRSSPEDFLCDT